MALKKLSELLKNAQNDGYAVGYFEAWDTYSFEAVTEAAEEEKSPVVLGFGGTMMDQQWLSRFGIEPLGAYGRAIAEKAKVPVSFVLNEVLELKHIAQGVPCGYNVVMLDSCHLAFDENVAITRQVVELAKPYGIGNTSRPPLSFASRSQTVTKRCYLLQHLATLLSWDAPVQV